jgi:hypothetical protein
LVVVKLTMTLLANPEKVIYRLMKNSFIRQMNAFFSICTQANLTLTFGPHADGAPCINLQMMRDDDDRGVPNPADPNMPLVGFKKEGLFTPDQPLFDDMVADAYEEWTVVNRSFSDHPFHMH